MIEEERVKGSPGPDETAEDAEAKNAGDEARAASEDGGKPAAGKAEGCGSGTEAEAGPEDEKESGAGDAGIGPEPEPDDADETGSDDSGGMKSGGTESSAEEESFRQKYVRVMADFQNYKRRTEKEKADVYARAEEEIITSLLHIVDNFERALDQECSDEAYAKGVELIFKELMDVLEKEGLKEIDAVGQDFDPNFHHAVMTDDNDEFESGKVTAVMQKGYTLKDRVIRPAMVRVNN